METDFFFKGKYKHLQKFFYYKLKLTKEGKFITMICIPFLVVKNIHHFESYFKIFLSRIYHYKVI